MPGRGRRGRGPDEIADGDRAGRGEQPLEDGQVEPFVFQGEREMTFQACVRRVARRMDAPAVSLHELVPFTDGAEAPGKRHPQIVGPDQRRVARAADSGLAPPRDMVGWVPA